MWRKCLNAGAYGALFPQGKPHFRERKRQKGQTGRTVDPTDLLIKAAFFENIQNPKYREETDNRQNANPAWLHGKPLLIVKRILIGRVVGRVTPHHALAHRVKGANPLKFGTSLGAGKNPVFIGVCYRF